MSRADSTTETRFFREQILERYGIKKDKYYSRLKFLGLKTRKDSDNKAYLTSEQVTLLDELDSYIKENGKMEGFSPSKSQIETGAMVKASDNSIEQKGEDIYVEPQDPTEQFDLNQLVRSAAELKAQNLAMPDLVKLGLAEKMTFDDLPDDLKAKVAAAREAANPKYQPANLAANLLGQWRKQNA